jgi:hypothetical protein
LFTGFYQDSHSVNGINDPLMATTGCKELIPVIDSGPETVTEAENLKKGVVLVRPINDQKRKDRVNVDCSCVQDKTGYCSYPSC